MRRARVALAVGALALGLGACTSEDPLDASPGPLASPTGWRWESFGDAEVSVPADWGHGTGDVASALWCISDAGVAPPSVVRPGIQVEPTCPGPAPSQPDPSTTVEKGGRFVSLVYAASDPGARLGAEGDRTTLRIGAVLLRVQAPQAQRVAILGTVRQISVDANGCPTSDPISTLPTRRPSAPVAVGELDDVRSVTACRYAIPGGKFADPGEEFVEPAPAPAPSDDPAALPSELSTPAPSTLAPLLPSAVPAGFPTLLSSVELDGDEAKAAVRAIADSASGTGPDADNGCADPLLRGPEAIVLRITRGSGTGEVYLRYGGCRNGFDDGVADRMLSRSAVAPFVTGANSVPTFGAELARILDDPNAPATSGDPQGNGENPEASTPPDGAGTTP